MRVVVLTSNELRHKYFLKVISENFDLEGAIYEDKGQYYSKQKEQSIIVKRHFEKLSLIEKDFFYEEVNSYDFNIDKIKSISKNEINNNETINWIKKLNPELIFLFGTGILKEDWLDTFKDRIINLHLGLSPFYRGSATLFWPFFNNELQCVGATIHLATKKVDAGDILKRIKPEIKSDDNYYTINYKTIKSAIDTLPIVAQKFKNNEISLLTQDMSNSKVYKKSDFTEEALLQVIDKYSICISKEEMNNIKESKECICCQ